MKGCGGVSEEVESVGLEQLSLLLGHAFTLGGDVPAHYLWEFLVHLASHEEGDPLPPELPWLTCSSWCLC